ncbi:MULTISPECIES: AAA family ATPase [Bacillaceae]|uniref:Nuclease SbcCD subunit C n=1 Tax=Bacillus norwichensis TaxID=2762217 RepID=A0ABR8VQN8_9BACI|nr:MULTISPECIES: SMC family ATPase [Bacillaceae]MBD8007078.1 SMC family ATPase [Bacillus norwichensis]
MRIEQINIENFRCFKGLNKFNVDGKTIIIFGENGYGKSSIFDAIEWCLTGEIDRFKQPGKGLNKKVIANRQAEEGEKCSVELTIDEVKFIRSFRISENPRESIVVKNLSDKIIAQGKENVEKYIEENIANKNTNKKLLSALIKRSHLLAQDQITDFVLRDNPKDRFNALANIMGYRQLINMAKNLNKVKNNVNQYISSLSQDVSTYNQIIDSKQKEKVEFNLIDFNNQLNRLGINIDQEKEQVQSEIKKKEEILLDSKSKLDSKLSQIQKINNPVKELSYNNLNDSLIHLQSLIQKDREDINRIELLTEKINSENKDITSKITNIEAQNNLFVEKEKLEKEISILDSEIKEYGFLEKDITEQLNQIEHYQNQLFYAQTHLESYLKDQKTIEDSLRIMQSNRLYIEKSKRRISRFNKYLSIFNPLLDNERESTSLNNLNDAIKEVYSYVEKNNKDKVCPVCSTEKENLSQTILDNIERNLYIIQKNSNKISKTNDIVKRINNKINDLTKSISKINNEQKNLKTNLELAKSNIDVVSKNALFNNELFEMSYEKITAELKVSSERINEFNSMKVKYHTITTLKNKLNKYPRTKRSENFLTESDLQSRLKTLDRRKSFLQKQKENKEKIISDNESMFNKNNQILFMLSDILPNDKKDVTIESVFEEIRKERNEITVQIDLIRNVYDTYQKLIKNSSVESSIREYNEVVSKKKKEMENFTQEYNMIDEFRERIYEQVGDKASDLLNKPDSKIQKYFRYLNPVPNVSEVLFDSPNPEELEIILSYKSTSEKSENKINVQHSLSSGQLYVLAISVFLAINEEQTVSKLDFVGIDDPIQNMDDVNQFSVCDVLSTIEKQLIFTTHDWDFLKLYLKKNEHKSDSIQVFLLENKDSLVTNIKKVTFNN